MENDLPFTIIPAQGSDVTVLILSVLYSNIVTGTPTAFSGGPGALFYGGDNGSGGANQIDVGDAAVLTSTTSDIQYSLLGQNSGNFTTSNAVNAIIGYNVQNGSSAYTDGVNISLQITVVWTTVVNNSL